MPLHITLPKGQNVQVVEAGMVHTTPGLTRKDVLYIHQPLLTT